MTRPRSHAWPRRLAAGAAVLAAAAAVNLVRTRRAEAADPPHGRFVFVDGIRVHYVSYGQSVDGGPPIVLIHGNGSMVQDFELSGVVGRLAERHRVILFDRPGSGYTERPRGVSWTPEAQADLLVRAAAQLGLERPVVVGHSWGTLVALAWALDHPDRIGALGLASGYYFPTPRPDVLSTLPAVVPVLGDIMRWTVSPLLGRLTIPAGNRLIFGPAATTAAFASSFPFELGLRPAQIQATTADTAQMPLAAARLAPRYAELPLALPILILAGDGDRLVDFDTHTAALAEQLPQARLVRVAGAGHMVHHIAPEAFADAVETLASAVYAPASPAPKYADA